MWWFSAVGVADRVRDVPDKHSFAIRRDALLDEPAHSRVFREQPLLKSISEDWCVDGVLIVGWLGDATFLDAFVAHAAVDRVTEERVEMLSY